MAIAKIKTAEERERLDRIFAEVEAAVPYICKGDVKMSVYWISAGVLTLAVTWL